MQATPDKKLKLERTFDATPLQLYNAWIDPKQYAKWINPAAGIDAVIHTFEAKPGGRVAFDMPQPDGNKNPQEGVFHVLEPGKRIVSGDADKKFLIEVTFQAKGPTRTHMVVDVTGVPPDWHTAATQGWGACFDKLTNVLKTRA